MKRTAVFLCAGFAALASFGSDMVVDKSQWVFDSEDSSAYYFAPTVPLQMNVVALGTGPCTNAPWDMTNIVSVSVGDSHVLALRADGTLTGWGDDTYGELDIPDEARTNSVQISAGINFSVALLGDGTAQSWGNSNSSSIFGSGLVEVASVGTNEAFLLTSSGDAQSVINGTMTSYGFTNAVAIAGSTGTGNMTRHMVLLSDGTIRTWGINATNAASAATNVVAIAQGSSLDLVLKADQSAFRFSPGNGANVVYGTNAVKQITAYGNMLYALRTNGILEKYVGTVIPPTNRTFSAISAGKSAVVGILAQ